MAAVTAGRIFVFFECFALGGVELSALNYIREWLAAGRHVTLFVGAADGPLQAHIPDGVELVTPEREIESYTGMFAPVIRAARAARPDLIFVPGNRYTAIGLILKIALGRAAPPFVVKLSNSLELAQSGSLKRSVYRCFLRLQAKLFDHAVAMSPGLSAEAQRFGGFAAPRLSVVADPPSITAAPQGLSDSAARLVAVGRCTPQKRFDRLLRALARTPRPIALDLIGDGPDLPALVELAAGLGIAHRVTFHGFLPDPSAMVTRARALVLSSDYEGLPAVAIEALAAGTPVVTTDCTPAFHDLLTSPVLGRIVPRDDERALADALTAAALIAPDRTAIRAAVKLATWPGSARRYLVLFDGLVRGQRRRRAAPAEAGPVRRPALAPVGAALAIAAIIGAVPFASPGALARARSEIARIALPQGESAAQR
ncbi:MAG: glycosyltransferase [Sphingomonadaceae bacterium]|nr:glycosyltransferase [Sphingomonadaceae bacterium]